jgi:hypothetical protein
MVHFRSMPAESHDPQESFAAKIHCDAESGRRSAVTTNGVHQSGMKRDKQARSSCPLA